MIYTSWQNIHIPMHAIVRISSNWRINVIAMVYKLFLNSYLPIAPFTIRSSIFSVLLKSRTITGSEMFLVSRSLGPDAADMVTGA